MVGIYKIVNKVNNKVYIGQSIHLEERKIQHWSKLRNNKSHNYHLQQAWNKYGEDSFEFIILLECKKDELDEKEEFFISLYNALDISCGYNVAKGGNASSITEKTREKISNSVKELWKDEKYRNNQILKSSQKRESYKRTCLARYGVENFSQLPEVRKKISESKKGHIVSEETREKLRQANLGKTYSKEVNMKKGGDRKGKKLIYDANGKRCYFFPEEIPDKLKEGYITKEEYKRRKEE